MTLSVGLISLGCAKNLVDTEHMADVLGKQGIPLALVPEKADVLLVNTCGFIGDAKQESIEAILSACARKRAGQCRAVIVAGCLAQRYRRELPAEIPEVDAFVGLDELGQIGAIVRRLQAGEQGVRSVSAVSRAVFDPAPDRPLLTGGGYAYVKIAEGCSRRCSFCAIPHIRGRYRSRAIEAIVREAEGLLVRGVRELNLIAQDIMAYGMDLHNDTRLTRLLRRLDRIGGDFWIRLLYGNPARMTEELLATMAASSRVCHYLDLPIQHSHPDILRAMNRRHTCAAIAELPIRIRRVIPDVVLRTTCLVGFPGETEAHFRHLLDYIRHAEFDHLGVFVYSPEEGTRAASLPGRVSMARAQDRRRRLMLAQQAIVRRRSANRIGQEARILVEKKASRRSADWLGRWRGQAPEVDGVTRLTGGAARLRAGMIVSACFTGYSGYDLTAHLV